MRPWGPAISWTSFPICPPPTSRRCDSELIFLLWASPSPFPIPFTPFFPPERVNPSGFPPVEKEPEIPSSESAAREDFLPYVLARASVRGTLFSSVVSFGIARRPSFLYHDAPALLRDTPCHHRLSCGASFCSLTFSLFYPLR